MDEPLEEMLRRLREKAEKKRTRGNELVEADYRADMKAIERLKALDDDGGSDSGIPLIGLHPLPPILPGASASAKKIGPTPATREAIKNLTDGFTVRDVEGFIQRYYPNAGIKRPALASALNKLTAMGEIEVTRKSQGKGDPGVYRRKVKQP